jgi:hypothetical protein
MSDENKPKIIVDDDWKTRVQAERESLRTDGDDDSSPKSPPPSRESEPADGQLPPATFESLVSMLVTQTLASLGQIPIGDEQKPVVMLDHAKFHIDLLSMLEEKTNGNLTPAEANLLTNLLHELRMVFVAVKNRKA